MLGPSSRWFTRFPGIHHTITTEWKRAIGPAGIWGVGVLITVITLFVRSDETITTNGRKTDVGARRLGAVIDALVALLRTVDDVVTAAWAGAIGPARIGRVAVLVTVIALFVTIDDTVPTLGHCAVGTAWGIRSKAVVGPGVALFAGIHGAIAAAQEPAL